MRIPFATLLPVVVSLTTWVASAHHDGGAPLEARGSVGGRSTPTPAGLAHLKARDWMDRLNTRDLEIVGDILERREVLAEFSTRDLIDELSDRLERRGNIISKKKTYKCPYCGRTYDTFDQAKACATLPAILGGCKVAQAVRL
ncbi:hypothetical protein EST38_g8613 [Candolleomyces aberdarensis]|uniref:Uncharacterized protein n=1 Tax=Candolleomyces aberdarensis TaxID=2316362 RepID=A0A4Q2DCU3_9AGAR|nr:hypothetical protein EST38_g8613 [Candolleomyces aberdarensis]